MPQALPAPLFESEFTGKDFASFANYVRNKYHYNLPNRENTQLLIPVSGGADSAVVACVLLALFPEENWHLLFTDTLADDPGVYDTLDHLEAFLGRRITRLVPDNGGLLGLIEKWGGFLPGGSARWCTKHLKLKPFEGYCDKLLADSDSILSFVGIRADEDRTGLVSHDDRIETVLPFKEVGIGRQEVFDLLQRSIGVPQLYQTRTRSGCFCCPYQSKREYLGLLDRHPKLYEISEGLEKLTPDDLSRIGQPGQPLSHEMAMGANHMTLPLPPRIDARTRTDAIPHSWIPVSAKRDQTDLFGDTIDLWVGAEFFIHPGVGDHGIWWQSFVSFSTTRGGLARQLQNHYWHRLDTAEVKGLTRDEMASELQLAMYHLRFPAHLINTDSPHKNSYTWQQNVSLAQLRVIHSWILRTLHNDGLHQELQECRASLNGQQNAWTSERIEILETRLANITDPVGEVLQMDRYDPPKMRPDVDEREVTCFHCSL